MILEDFNDFIKRYITFSLFKFFAISSIWVLLLIIGIFIFLELSFTKYFIIFLLIFVNIVFLIMTYANYKIEYSLYRDREKSKKNNDYIA